MKSMIDMAMLYMFLNIYYLNPSQTTTYQSYVDLPWSPKIIYGIIMDCFPICGSGKRSYVFICGMLQGLSCLVIVLYHFDNAGWVCLFCSLNALGGAFQDVVADGLMVVAARNDPKQGSEELQSLSWGMYGMGGILGCIMSGYFLSGQTPDGTPDGNPYPCFIVMTIFGLLIGFSGLFIDKSLEDNQESMKEMGVFKRTGFVFGEVWSGL
jgi:MFS family permease